MENQNIIQPLDTLMTQLGITNAALVEASTEQLSFKMVQKGRKGRPLTPNVQEKILNALLKVKPDLKIRRRELFHYPMDESNIQRINDAFALIEKKKIKYPKFIDLLLEAGIHHYAVKVASHEITFYGSAGQAHIVRKSEASQGPCGSFDLKALVSAIEAAQKEKINHATFLQKIHEAGILRYEVNLHQRKIVYKGELESHREEIPSTVSEPEVVKVKPAKAVIKKDPKVKPAQKKIVKRKKKPGVVRMTRKARVDARKRFFKKRKK